MSHKFITLLKYYYSDKILSKGFKVLFFIILIIGTGAVFLPQVIKLDEIFDDNNGSVGIKTSSTEDFELFKDYHMTLFDNEVELTTLSSDFEEQFDYVIDLDTNTIYISPSSQYKVDQLRILIENFYLTKDLSDEREQTEIKQFSSVSTKTTDDGRLYVITYLTKFLLYFLLIYSVQLLAPDILEEKSSKHLEVVLSSVNSSAHLMSKVLSTMLYILTLALAFVLTLSISVFVAKLVFSEPIILLEFVKNILGAVEVSLIPFIILMSIFFTISIVTFLVIVAVYTSTFTSVEDVQSSTTSVVLIIVAGFISSLMIQDLEILKLISYIPIVNVFVIPDLYLNGTLSITDVSICISISIVILVLIIIAACKIYRISVLNYSTKGLKNTLKFFKNNG